MELSNKIYFPDEIWIQIKDFMPIWKQTHKRKLENSLKKRDIISSKNSSGYQGIESLFPTSVVWETYSRESKLYTVKFKTIFKDKYEIRISNFYDYEENNWNSYLCRNGILYI